MVVGAGHAGVMLAGQLRQHGHTGPIDLVSAERDLPYHRPPLSKKHHLDELVQPLRPTAFWAEQDITLHRTSVVERIDRTRQEVVLPGRRLAYDSLVIATGAEPRRLDVPGAGLDGVLTLRSLPDARELWRRLGVAKRLVVVGGGYVGLEVAAVARLRGSTVTVLEREHRVLARVASAELSAFLAAHHSDAGVIIRTGVEIAALEGVEGQVTAVRLADGGWVDCDLVLVGVGAVPRDDLAVAAGLACDAGIKVDLDGRTGDPKILAIGDVTRRPVPGWSGLARLESIPSSTEQAKRACAVILGSPPPAPEVPWSWSDQGPLKVKIAGLVAPGTRTVVRRGPAPDRFAVYHHRDGVVTAAETVNAPGDFMTAKKLIASATRLDPARLADPQVDAAALLRAGVGVGT